MKFNQMPWNRDCKTETLWSKFPGYKPYRLGLKTKLKNFKYSRTGSVYWNLMEYRSESNQSPIMLLGPFKSTILRKDRRFKSIVAKYYSDRKAIIQKAQEIQNVTGTRYL